MLPDSDALFDTLFFPSVPVLFEYLSQLGRFAMDGTKHKQENVDFTVLEEGIEALYTNLTSVENRQVNNEVCTTMLHIMFLLIKYTLYAKFLGKNPAG